MHRHLAKKVHLKPNSLSIILLLITAWPTYAQYDYVEEVVPPNGLLQLSFSYGLAAPLGIHAANDLTDRSSGFAKQGHYYRVSLRHTLKNRAFLGIRMTTSKQELDYATFTNSAQIKGFNYDIFQIQAFVGYGLIIKEKYEPYIRVAAGTSIIETPNRRYNLMAANNIRQRSSLSAANLAISTGFRCYWKPRIILFMESEYNTNSIKDFPRFVIGKWEYYNSRIANLYIGAGTAISL